MTGRELREMRKRPLTGRQSLWCFKRRMLLRRHCAMLLLAHGCARFGFDAQLMRGESDEAGRRDWRAIFACAIVLWAGGPAWISFVPCLRMWARA
jgi:hypothetical protein